LAWLHSVIIERLRYRPIGWSKSYEFNETDAICSLNILDHWYDKVAGVRQNISPDEIPCEAIQTMLSQSIYGGRIDSVFDQKLLDSFINYLFRPENFNINFPLATSFDSSASC
jgi:dynein heavy chain 1